MGVGNALYTTACSEYVLIIILIEKLNVNFIFKYITFHVGTSGEFIDGARTCFKIWSEMIHGEMNADKLEKWLNDDLPKFEKLLKTTSSRRAETIIWFTENNDQFPQQAIKDKQNFAVNQMISETGHEVLQLHKLDIS